MEWIENSREEQASNHIELDRSDPSKYNHRISGKILDKIDDGEVVGADL